MKKVLFLVLAISLAMTGCKMMGLKYVDDSTELRSGLVKNKYEAIKKIVIEEAANNGFNQLTSEVKPSQYNDWQGKLYFSFKTPAGTDQLIIEFDKDEVKLSGFGSKSNPESAVKAIRARIEKL